MERDIIYQTNFLHLLKLYQIKVLKFNLLKSLSENQVIIE